jgi:hypothetical protein
MSKTVEFRQPDKAKVDAFVETGTVPREHSKLEVMTSVPAAMRQLTVDIPESLHMDLKMECVRLGMKNYEVVRRALMDALAEVRKLRSDEGQTWLAR